MPTPFSVTERKHRRLVLETEPDWGMLGCGAAFFAMSFFLTCWALAYGLLEVPLIHSATLLLLDGVLLYLGLYCMILQVGTEQVLTLDKNLNALTLTTKRITGATTDRYRLSDVIKVHHNLVDDGTFDKHAVLLIFKGGGALQFPLGGGQPASVASLVPLFTNFLGVGRSDAPVALEKVVQVAWQREGRDSGREAPTEALP